MSSKDITLYSHTNGPNPWKVAIVLECLGLSYEHKFLVFEKGEHKVPEFTNINPNGRVPAIIDHKNGDFQLWESNAIVLYLIDRYDKEHKISASTPEEKAIQNQYLFFQASGQGPYFGQWVWFKHLHQEKIASAEERYKNEIRRVLGVLDGILANREWLVGSKCTVADLSFLLWNHLPLYMDKVVNDVDTQFQNVTMWHNKMLQMPQVKKVLEYRQSLNSARGATSVEN
ncbi:glutathione S-transferase [Atractiella rhizophila]|nr:glutathione S-transferase [Atractiella rhizophila]